MNPMENRSLDTGAVVSVALAFTFAVVYRGAGDNLPFLAYGSLPLLAALALEFGRRPGALISWSVIHTLALVYVVYMGMAIFWSTLPENSFFTFWVLGALPLTFVVSSQFDDERWRMLLRLLLVSGVVSALWGIAAFLLSGHRASGPLIDPNAWAAMLNLLFFGVLTHYLTIDGTSRGHLRACEILLFLLVTAFFSAYSRAATVVFLVIFTAFAAWVGVTSREMLRRFTTGALIALVSFSLVHGYASQTEASHAEGYTLNVEDKAWSQRFAEWEGAWQVYLEHPLTGTGLGTFKVQYPRHRTEGDLWSLGNYVHNDYIQLLQEGGPLQLLFVVSLIALLVAILGRQWWSWRQGEEEASRLEVVGLILAMGTAFGHSLLTFTLYQMPVSMLVGAYLGRVVRLVGGRTALVRRVKSPLPGAVLTLLLVVPWSLLAMDCLSYALVYGQRWIPFAAAIARDPLLFHDTLHDLVSLRPGTSVNHLALATIYRKLMEQQSDPESEEALGVAVATEYRRSLDDNPFQYMVYVYYADLLAEHPKLAEAGEVHDTPTGLLETAIAMAPVYLEPYTALAQRYQAEGDTHRAYLLLKERALPWIDLEHWNHERERARFIYKMLELSRAEGDDGLVGYLERRLRELKLQDISSTATTANSASPS